MTKKDYVMLAQVVRGQFQLAKDCADVEGKAAIYTAAVVLMYNLIAELARDNPRFDEIKFEDACRGEE